MPGFGDRKGTEELGRQVLRLVAAKFAGGRLEPDLARWVEGLPMEFKKKLARHGLLEAERIAAVKPLAEHLDDWKAALLAKGNSDRHAELVVSRARKAFAACRFKFHGDISASKLQKHLGDLRDDLKDAKGNVKRGISAQTFNFYQQACKQFCRWMLKDGRAWMNPLEHLSALNVRTDRRHDRREDGSATCPAQHDHADHGPLQPHDARGSGHRPGCFARAAIRSEKPRKNRGFDERRWGLYHYQTTLERWRSG